MTVVSNPPKLYFAADLVAVIAVQTSRILETLLALKLLPSRPEYAAVSRHESAKPVQRVVRSAR